MSGPKYDWEKYRAIDAGNTEFSKRNHELHVGAAEAASSLSGKIRALEFGTAEGIGSEYFLKRYPEMKLTSMDKDQNALSIALDNLHTYHGRVELIPQDFLSFTDSQKYDLVFGIWVTHNFPEDIKEQFLKKSYDLLRPNGLLILGDVITSSSKVLNKMQWADEYALLDELDPKDKAFWKKHYDEYDHKYARSFEWYQKALHSIGFSASALSYSDGFWQVVKARK